MEKLTILLPATTSLEELAGRLHPDLLLHTSLEVTELKQRYQLLLAFRPRVCCALLARAALLGLAWDRREIFQTICSFNNTQLTQFIWRVGLLWNSSSQK